MHLATTFADVIIKIRKAVRPKLHDDDEDITYGIINETCVFRPTDKTRQIWSNGDEQFETAEFEEYLRKK